MSPVSLRRLHPFTLTVAGPATRVRAYLKTLRAAADQATPDRLTLTVATVGVVDPETGTSRAWVTGLTSAWTTTQMVQLAGPTALDAALVVETRALTRAGGGWPARAAAFYAPRSQALLVRAGRTGAAALDAAGVWHVTAGQLPTSYDGVRQFTSAWAGSPGTSLVLTQELLLPIATLGPALPAEAGSAAETVWYTRAVAAGGWAVQFNAAYGIYYAYPEAAALLAYLDANRGALLGAGLSLFTRWPSALAFVDAADELAAAGRPVGELAVLHAVAAALVCRGLSAREAELIGSALAAGGGRPLSRVLARAGESGRVGTGAPVPLSSLLHACAGLSQARTDR